MTTFQRACELRVLLSYFLWTGAYVLRFSAARVLQRLRLSPRSSLGPVSNSVTFVAKSPSAAQRSSAAKSSGNGAGRSLPCNKPGERCVLERDDDMVELQDGCADLVALDSAHPDFDDQQEKALVELAQQGVQRIFELGALGRLPNSLKEAAGLMLQDSIAGRLRTVHAVSNILLAEKQELNVLHAGGSLSYCIALQARRRGMRVREYNRRFRSVLMQALFRAGLRVSADCPGNAAIALNHSINSGKSLPHEDAAGRLVVIADDGPSSRYWEPLTSILDTLSQKTKPLFISTRNITARNSGVTLPSSRTVALHTALAAMGVLREMLKDQSSFLDKQALGYLFPVLYSFFRQRLPGLATVVGMAETIIDEQPAGVLVAPGRNPVSIAYLTQAKEKKVKTFDFQPIMVSPIPRYNKPLCDVCFVVDGSQADLAERHFGVARESLVPIGSARVTGPLPSCNMGAGVPNVLLVCQPFNEGAFCEVIRTLCAASDGGSLFTVTVTPHPKDSLIRIRHYTDLVGEIGAEKYCSVVEKGQTEKLVHQAKVVVTFYSNVGYDAAIAGRTVVIVADQAHECAREFDLLGDLVLRADISTLAETVRGAISTDAEEQMERRRAALFEKFPYLKPGASRAIVRRYLGDISVEAGSAGSAGLGSRTGPSGASFSGSAVKEPGRR